VRSQSAPHFGERLLLGTGLDVDARRPRRRLLAGRATDDRERGRPAGQGNRGDSGNQPWPLATPPGSAGLLKRLRQPGNDILRGRQFLGESLLGGLQIPGQLALSITTAQIRRARLNGVRTQPDEAAGDVYRADRRVCQTAA
jgi:hypothetical protein